MFENRRAIAAAACAVVLLLLLAWRWKRAGSARAVAVQTSAASAPGLPTPSAIPDASDGLGRAFRFITGAPMQQYAPKPANLTPDQLARLKGSVADTVVVAPPAAKPMPGSFADTPSAAQTAARAAGTVSGLLTGVFG